jgi:hypothetical protein
MCKSIYIYFANLSKLEVESAPGDKTKIIGVL